MDIISKITSLMNEQNVTATKLTNDLKIAKNAISEWKKGRIKPSLETTIKLAKYFGVSTDYLLGLTDNPTQIKKEFDEQDKLNYEISKLTPEKRANAKQYIEFLKTQEEFSKDISELVDTFGQKPLPE